MRSKRFGSRIFVRLDPGDEVVTSLKAVCQAENVRLGVIASGLGAVSSATVGLFEPDTKKYHSSELRKPLEITALAGNITTMKGEVYLHPHATLADIEHNAFGGHLNAAIVSCTAEIVIEAYEGELDREFDEKIGLNLLKP